MRISAISNQYSYSKPNSNIIKQNVSTSFTQPNTVQSNYLHFTGLFNRGKNKDIKPFSGDENGMSAYDYTISFKVADILHRLDDESILVIGTPIFSKGKVQSQLTREDSNLQNPKNIKTVYMINHNSSDTMIIQKRGKDKFHIYGHACNLTNPNSLSRRHMNDDFYKYNFDNDAKYGDVIESKDSIKIKFLQLPKESNTPMFDAKYPVESFLSDSMNLTGGLVINKPEQKMSAGDVKRIQSDSKYSREIPFRTFDDVAGMDDSVEFMKKTLMYPIMYPNAFKDDKNKGMILYGPPGTGKTLLVLATIGEIKKQQNKDVHFVKINSRDLEQQYVGVSEGMWREVFQELVDNQPSVLFIDEIDALMVDRNKTSDSSHNSMTSQVSQLLQSIDELEKTNAQVWIVGATNRPDSIDPAFKRSGRIGELRKVERPDEKGCRKILDLYLEDKNVSEEFDRDKFAKKCYDIEYTGADIAQIVAYSRNEMYKRCGIFDKMDDKTYTDDDLTDLQYTQSDFDRALEKQKVTKKLKQNIGFRL